MEICIENDHYIYVFILQFFVYQFHIKIKKVFTQGFNSIFEFINIIYVFSSFALIFGPFLIVIISTLLLEYFGRRFE